MENIKITNPEDINVAEQILNKIISIYYFYLVCDNL